MEKAMQNVSRRGFVGLAGVAAAVAGTAALAGCSPSKNEKNDVASGDATKTTVVAGHERAGLPSFLVAPDPITDIKKTLDFDVVVVGAGAAGVPAALEIGRAHV